MSQYYRKTKEELLDELDSNIDGLTKERVLEQREKFGTNKLEENKTKNVFEVFISQFFDLLVIILIAAAIISMLTGNVESTFVILGVIIVNAILGTVQHFKAEKSLKSLKALTSPVAKVIRDGVKIEIPSDQIVVGDIVSLEAGELIDADGRIIENFSLQVNESALTGESESVTKTSDILDDDDGVAIGDQVNMVFSSSMVTYGRALVLVTAVGMNTELGKIATLLNATAERKTPLQISLDDFSKKLSFGILIICVIIFGLSIYRKMAILDSLMFAVALAVAAIPEALSSIVTIALAIGTTKMARENAIIKNLTAVEGLGCVSIICSDKTGTLTQNKMTVQHLFTLGDTTRLSLISILCNDTFISEGIATGDPTETALVTHYIKENSDYENTISKNTRIAEIPFDSNRKLMSTVHLIDGEHYIFTKGAVDVLLNRVDSILDNTVVRPITDEDIKKIQEQNHQYSNSGLRVLAFAQKTTADTNVTIDSEHNYTFVGLISMMDPPRVEAKEAVSNCFLAGIKPIMITGDHKITASAIAREIGILTEKDISVDGASIDKLSDQELIKLLPTISVYARVSPEHKIRIVDLWQRLGHIVAMTGDGVNDAPALKKADIGIAMGITGTAVSKDAASMILTDDNFATIIKSVTNGRNIYSNIKNSIKFLLSGNASGIFTVLYTSILALPIPFTAVHLLFINLLTDSLPAIAISMEKPTKQLLKEKPRSNSESILTRECITDIVFQGILITICTVLAYHKGLLASSWQEIQAHLSTIATYTKTVELSHGTASTMAFSTLCLARLFHGFNLRGNQSIFRLGLFRNVYSIYAFLIGSTFLASALFIPPLQKIFEVTPLSTENVLTVVLFAFIPTIIIQVIKIIKDFKASN